jgi:hypothetical protein
MSAVTFRVYVTRLLSSGLAARVKRFYVVPLVPKRAFAIVCIGDRGPAAARAERERQAESAAPQVQETDE